ncbi:MAG: PEP/pyruvate-binding domain-containing protein [Burkholderiaceae bacterium]
MNKPQNETGLPPPALIGCGETGILPDPQAIGFKAHNLARMARIGLPVPAAFVLGTAWCMRPEALEPAVWMPALAALEHTTGLRFGDPRHPLLLSVRSGAPVSMPGMMETLLNIGLGDATLPGLVRLTGNPRLAWDAYRRLVAGYGEIVLGLPPEAFEADLAVIAGERSDRDLDFSELRALTRRHLETVERLAGEPFPQDPPVQLERAIRAVFGSWSADKARAYRHMHRLDDRMGTAVTVQRMVFGNAGGASGAGVGFTRHPSTGEASPWVDFLFNAQGEDVVSGRRNAQGHEALAELSPRVWSELSEAMLQLEQAFGDMQDFEFTVEEGHLYMLQTRNGKRTPQAAARIALDLHDEGLLTRAEALERTAELDEIALAETRIVSHDGLASEPLAMAVSACSGVAVGELVLDEELARSRHAAGASVVLVRQDAETRDLSALELAAGLLTRNGARTSHAAVVARQLGKVCLVGCESLQIDERRRRVRIAGHDLAEGDVLTLDGHSGAVYAGAVRTLREAPADLLRRLEALRAAV